MKQSDYYSAVVLMGDHALSVESFASACETDVPTILLFVEEGLIESEVQASVLSFSGEALARARRILRLQRDFEANLQSVAVMIDLLDENERLRKQLRQLGKLNL
jgi:chaperone modulatory protein CbpM